MEDNTQQQEQQPEKEEGEFLDTERILSEEDERLIDELAGDEEVDDDYFYNPTSKAYRCCHTALKRQTQMTLFWVLFLLAFLGAIGALYATKVLDFSNSNSKCSQKEAILVIPFASMATLGLMAKIIAVKRQNRYYSVEKKRFLKGLPDKPNELVQEFYVLQYCRRSSQFWIMITLVGLSIVTGVYCVIVSGILKAAGIEGKSRLFNMTGKLGFGEDTVAGLTSLSWMVIPFWLLCYAIARSRSTKIIKALEEVYPPDKIMDECLCNHRLSVNNRKQKLIAFAIVCWLGCVVYLLFKKLICNIFEKSFYI
ncbi:hypothetical protein A6V39_02280 [Candidatus Mycoplasma haematobovis]|uniref:Transmembrane protein n=1 Tax=Candidatus Mycoplasma haematobovis TaxID=432608 RepID=A0A1A9QEW5_9MOLU|nr:hypothetical protein [Candidatus Mycoplasma haematobovis]OAL10249.1 hypothetical protein A6V39_02280 [Candidatus Mycoplasma haematobovis]